MKITDVEAIVLRRHDPVRDISDGTQDTLVVRIRTDAGLTGIGLAGGGGTSRRRAS